MLAKIKSKSRKAREAVAARAQESASCTPDDVFSDNELDDGGALTPRTDNAQLDISLGGLNLQYEGRRWRAIDSAGKVHEAAGYSQSLATR